MPQKNITLISPIFPPELLPAGKMCNSLALEFASRGYKVNVITGFPNRPEGKVFSGFKRKFRVVSIEGPFSLIRCWTWLIGSNRRVVDRLLENVSFGTIVALNVLFTKKPDLILMDAWPAFAAFLISSAAKMRTIPCYYYVQDLLPEQAENTGMMEKGGLLSKIILWIDSKACSNSAGVLALSDTMAKHIAATRNVSYNKLLVAPIQVDVSSIYPVNRLNSWRDKHGIASNTFVVMYTGTLGHVSGISILNELVPKFTTEDNVLFICIGEGPLKIELELTSHKYRHLRLLPYQSDNDYLLALGAADIALLTIDQNCGVGSVPSKMYTYMAAEKPILTNAPLDTENARLINATGCGLLVNPGDTAGLENKIRYFIDKPEIMDEMGKAGRKYILENCTVEIVADKLEKFWSSTTTI